jgi:hypothetical protein
MKNNWRNKLLWQNLAPEEDYNRFFEIIIDKIKEKVLAKGFNVVYEELQDNDPAISRIFTISDIKRYIDYYIWGVEEGVRDDFDFSILYQYAVLGVTGLIEETVADVINDIEDSINGENIFDE